MLQEMIFLYLSKPLEMLKFHIANVRMRYFPLQIPEQGYRMLLVVDNKELMMLMIKSQQQLMALNNSYQL